MTVLVQPTGVTPADVLAVARHDAKVELAAVDEFDHQVVNHEVGEAAQKVVDLMRSRKGRR